MSYNFNKLGAVVTVNRSNNAPNANQVLTSAATSVPFLSGNMNQVAFNTCAIANTVGTGFTASGTLAGNGFSSPVIQTDSANGAYIDYVTPFVLPVGVYMIEYIFVWGNLSPIFDLTYKANGAGGYSSLRTAQDAYVSFGDGFSVFYREFVTITTGGQLMNLRWTANGKNAGSGAYFVRVGNISITLLG